MRKKRILFINEASYLATGYAIYGREVMSRLHASGKYEIAELATYGSPLDTRRFNIPWTYYGNAPDDQGNPSYHSNIANLYGAWRLEEVLLDFKPDFVTTISDIWMTSFIPESPFRKLFNWSHLAPVDSVPQDAAFLGIYANANAVFGYSDWACEVLKEEGGNKIRVGGTISPAAAPEFQPTPDKVAHKNKMGLTDCYVVGTVMRNQQRKLYPNLFNAFKQFLFLAPKEISKDAYLWLHCSYPDLGWDIPELLKESGIGHRVLFTYICEACGFVFPAFFSDAKCTCANCGQPEAKLTSNQFGTNNAQLADVYNCFDIYVQYAVCEGWGMPVVEAASCGVPVAAVDYSAMSDVCSKLGGYLIPVQNYFRESATQFIRAYPNDNALANILSQFFNLPSTLRNLKGQEMLRNVKQFNWDKAAYLWMHYYDSQPTIDNWDCPPDIFQSATEIPNNLSPPDLVRWSYLNVLGQVNDMYSYDALRHIKDLTHGIRNAGHGGLSVSDNSLFGANPEMEYFGVNEFIRLLTNKRIGINYWESRRSGRIQEPKPDFIVNKKV